MELIQHDLRSLFAQLGHAADEEDIERFIESHSSLPSNMRLHQAPFWSPAQACFLKDALLEDAEWAEVVDELSVRMRASPLQAQLPFRS